MQARVVPRTGPPSDTRKPSWITCCESLSADEKEACMENPALFLCGTKGRGSGEGERK